MNMRTIGAAVLALGFSAAMPAVVKADRGGRHSGGYGHQDFHGDRDGGFRGDEGRRFDRGRFDDDDRGYYGPVYVDPGYYGPAYVDPGYYGPGYYAPASRWGDDDCR